MKTNHNDWKSLLDYKSQDIPVYVLLLSAPVLLTFYRYFGSSQHFKAYFPQLATDLQGDITANILHFVAFSLLTFVLPILYCLLYWKRSPLTLGMQAGDFRTGIKFILFFVPIVVVNAWLGAKVPEVCQEYPLAKALHQLPSSRLAYELAYIVFYYIAWEFFFRGFLLFGLKDTFGGLNAILIQTISSCLVHIGKPFPEIVGSIIVGLLFGYIALRTRSIWYVLVIHALLGVLTDVFILANN